jgi:hypothetical protein
MVLERTPTTIKKQTAMFPEPVKSKVHKCTNLWPTQYFITKLDWELKYILMSLIEWENTSRIYNVDITSN